MAITVRAQVKDGRIEPEEDVGLREGDRVIITISSAEEELHRRRRFLEDVNRAYAELRADAQAWQEELLERQVWDACLPDGLNDD